MSKLMFDLSENVWRREKERGNENVEAHPAVIPASRRRGSIRGFIFLTKK